MNAWVFLGAGLLDELVGDPESWPHPVRAIGWVIARLDRARMRFSNPWLLRLLGVFLAVGVPAMAGTFAWIFCLVCGRWAWVAEILLGSWMLAGRSLRDSVRPVCHALLAGDLAQARQRLSYVVGRDTERLDEGEISRAGLETLAESLCDGVVAPLFWFAIAGLPGLWAFKAVNTLDSMVGHHEAPWTHFGWASARLDDVLNWIPARMTALLIALAGFSRKALTFAWRDGGKTCSPNAGVVEAAFAGVLNVQLGGLNYYDGVPKEGPRLGDPGRPLNAVVLREGLGLSMRVNVLAIASGTLVLALLRYFWLA